jgi:translin
MEGLDSLGEQMHAVLRAKNAARDRALEQSRTLIRHCSIAIRSVHRDEGPAAAQELDMARSQAAALRAGLTAYPDLYYAGYTQDALKELAEASIFFALVNEQPLPTPESLGVEVAAYLNGLGEAAGELRRRCLDTLRKGDTAGAERLLAMMDDIYSLLVTLDYPDGLTGGLRRTTDMVRGVSERTRGDLTLTLRLEAAEKAAAALEKTIRSRNP